MTDHAHLVITAAKVSTDAEVPDRDAVAVRDDRIVAVGSEHVVELIGPRSDVIAGRGGLVLPGFQDAQVHPPIASASGDVDYPKPC